jgi:hypothetical protein
MDMITLTTEQLMAAAKHIADAIVADALEGIVSVNAKEFGDLHSYVDANEYAIYAFDELGITAETNEQGYENMNAAEEVAFALFRLTAELNELRACDKQGAKVVYVHEGMRSRVLTVTDTALRSSGDDRRLSVVAEDEDGNFASFYVNILKTA